MTAIGVVVIVLLALLVISQAWMALRPQPTPDVHVTVDSPAPPATIPPATTPGQTVLSILQFDAVLTQGGTDVTGPAALGPNFIDEICLRAGRVIRPQNTLKATAEDGTYVIAEVYPSKLRLSTPWSKASGLYTVTVTGQMLPRAV
jgi:hypothetical protein